MASKPERDRRLPWHVRALTWARWLIKATLWTPVATLLDRLGFTPGTVQVFCLDAGADRVLVLRGGEAGSGLAPVQGLRRGALSLGLIPPTADVREDARRELLEEALVEAPPLSAFRLAERYRQGRYRQFDCTVLVVFCSTGELQTHEATAEGEPCWVPVNDALAGFGDKKLRELFADLRSTAAEADGQLLASLAPRHFLVGPPEAVQTAEAAAESPMDALWPMPLTMLAEARKLGARGFDEVYGADDRYAQELWAGMSTAARDCYRPDPRLWRDCRLLTARDVSQLLAGWREASIERLAAQGGDDEVRSIPGRAGPEVAHSLMGRSSGDISLDLIYDSEEDRVACFLTRGGSGGIVSDVVLYARMSARYLPIPVFFTHPDYGTEIGYKQPSTAEFGALAALYHRLNGAPVGNSIFFPDGTWSEYGITGHGRCFFRRAADPLLPAGGEPAATFVDVGLPERPRPGPE